MSLAFLWLLLFLPAKLLLLAISSFTGLKEGEQSIKTLQLRQITRYAGGFDARKVAKDF
ncbi:MAG: hypothetical protein HDR50_00310 [Desulfovibrio sp.]|uniref:hypothetical protein n=1 Tax=Desulfovibrio sp. TaxID=885 RepID=UPI001A6DD1B4|nr:hypothetical protein [Desulfovibrio sp.]MBD5416136.1 hypothetical protein [Desulfovibrio sp.]